MHTLKFYPCCRVVCSRDSLLQRCTVRGYAENAATSRDQLTILQGGTRVKDLYVWQAIRFVNAGDGKAAAILAGITARCQRDADSIAGSPQAAGLYRQRLREFQHAQQVFLHE